MSIEVLHWNETCWGILWIPWFYQKLSGAVNRLFSLREFTLFWEPYPIYNIRAIPIEYDVERVSDLQDMTIIWVIEELEAFTIPSVFCAFKHHFVWNTHSILEPENCTAKVWNLSCGHPELNHIAELLVLAYLLLGRDIDSELEDYIYGLLISDTAAQQEWEVEMKTQTETRQIFEMSQRMYSQDGKRLLTRIIGELRQKFHIS